METPHSSERAAAYIGITTGSRRSPHAARTVTVGFGQQRDLPAPHDVFVRISQGPCLWHAPVLSYDLDTATASDGGLLRSHGLRATKLCELTAKCSIRFTGEVASSQSRLHCGLRAAISALGRPARSGLSSICRRSAHRQAPSGSSRAITGLIEEHLSEGLNRRGLCPKIKASRKRFDRVDAARCAGKPLPIMLHERVNQRKGAPLAGGYRPSRSANLRADLALDRRRISRGFGQAHRFDTSAARRQGQHRRRSSYVA